MFGCFGVKDRVQQVLRVLRDFNFLSLFFPIRYPSRHPLLASSPRRRSFYAFSFSSIFLFLAMCARAHAERTTVYNGADESPPLFSSLFLCILSLYLLPFVSLEDSRRITELKVTSQRERASRYQKSRLQAKFNKPSLNSKEL